MEYKFEWKNEEEGTISFSEQNKLFLTAQVYITGKEEAELRLQDIVSDEKNAKRISMQEKIICKMTECVLTSFRLLWEAGFEETVLVEPRGTKTAEILDSTKVVQIIYKEYMMKRQIKPQKSTDCGPSSLKLTETEDGLVCKNKEGSFFCKLLQYAEELSGEQTYYLYEVEVKKTKRNRGIATACLSELFACLAKDGPVTVLLQVGSYNEPAVHLYQKLGFEVSEELCYYAVEE